MFRPKWPSSGITTVRSTWEKTGKILYVGLTTLPPSYANCLDIWEPQPLGTLRACTGQYRKTNWNGDGVFSVM